MSQQAQAVIQAQQKTAEPSSIKSSVLQRAAVIPAITPVHSGILQRCSGGVECPECRQKRLEREGMLQRSAVSAAPVNDVPPIVHEVLSSPGQSLDTGTRAFMEPRFGHDFSQVRVHTDARAAESARAVNALAYTVGRNVVFGEGEYEPGMSEGRRLLAHELTHVVQQGVRNSSLQEKLIVGQPDDAYEQEAEAQAANVIEGRGVDTVSIQGQPGIARLQRKIDLVKELTGTGCEPPTTSPAGPLFARVHFGFDKDHVSTKEEAEIDMFVTGSGGGSGLSNVRVDGYASTVGDERYNLHLSCRRAKAVRKELAKKLLMLSEASIATFAHGETSEWSDEKLKKGPEENQIAIISATPGASTKPVPAKPKPADFAQRIKNVQLIMLPPPQIEGIPALGGKAIQIHLMDYFAAGGYADVTEGPDCDKFTFGFFQICRPYSVEHVVYHDPKNDFDIDDDATEAIRKQEPALDVENPGDIWTTKEVPECKVKGSLKHVEVLFTDKPSTGFLFKLGSPDTFITGMNWQSYFFTVFSVQYPDGSIHHLKSFYWEVKYCQTFNPPDPGDPLGKSVSRQPEVKPSGVIDGAPSEPGLSLMGTPAKTTCNDIVHHAVPNIKVGKFGIKCP